MLFAYRALVSTRSGVLFSGHVLVFSGEKKDRAPRSTDVAPERLESQSFSVAKFLYLLAAHSSAISV